MTEFSDRQLDAILSGLEGHAEPDRLGKVLALADKNPDKIPDASLFEHKGHYVRRTGTNRFVCFECKVGWRTIKTAHVKRRNLLRR